jgi:hypothetical protein
MLLPALSLRLRFRSRPPPLPLLALSERVRGLGSPPMLRLLISSDGWTLNDTLRFGWSVGGLPADDTDVSEPRFLPLLPGTPSSGKPIETRAATTSAAITGWDVERCRVLAGSTTSPPVRAAVAAAAHLFFIGLMFGSSAASSSS